MRLSAATSLFSFGGIPMVGNLATGGVIGLTPDGAELCRALKDRDVASREVPRSCEELVEHLRAGGYLAEAPSPEPRLASAYLHVTQRCNLACLFCYSEGDDRNRLADPSVDDLRRAFDALVALGCRQLTISGGEPFLRDDLAQIASLARDAGISKVVVLTNGLLVTRERLEPLSGIVSCIAVAFDGCAEDSPAHLRGNQNYERLVRAVGSILSAGIEARVLPTLHAKNLDDMPRYRKLAESLGASLSYSLLTADACRLGDFALSPAQLRRLGVTAVSEGLPDNDSVEAPALAARRSCGAGVRTVSVAADGTVYPCHMLHVRELDMGNAFHDPIDKILGSDVARSMRRIDAQAIPSCSRCDAHLLCGGGCRARALMTSGDILGPDPYCELSRSYYEALGKLLARRFMVGGGA